MKKNLLLGIITLLTLSFCGCQTAKKEKPATEEVTNITMETTNTATETTDSTEKYIDIFAIQETQEHYEQMYREILDYNYKLISGRMENFDYEDGTAGVGEFVRIDGANAINTIGYAFVDSNKDGEVELVIGSINEEKDGKYFGQLIFSAYTYKDAPVLILEGWSRRRCCLLNDGTYYWEGSNGAMYSYFENNRLEENGTTLIDNDFYFTYEKDKNYEEIGYYHNLTGEWDKSVSEEISEADYTNSSIEYSSKMLTLEFKPFSMYEYSEDIQMNIEWGEEDKVSDGTLQFFEADTTKPQVAVIVSPNADVYNFKVLSLAYENVDSAGNPVFKATELYQQEELACGMEFVIKLTMYGTIPNYGISYEDVYGKTYSYGLTESGMDGSPLLTEIVVK